jgi:hypothetical protein
MTIPRGDPVDQRITSLQEVTASNHFAVERSERFHLHADALTEGAPRLPVPGRDALGRDWPGGSQRTTNH